MGVPGLTKWLSQNFPEFVVQSHNYKFLKDADERILCIDGNVLFHECVASVFGTGYGRSIRIRPKNFISEKENLSDLERLGRFVGKSVLKLMKLFDATFLYFVVDGIAPRPKILEQRQRRSKPSYSGSTFDSTLLTCGTKFLDDLYNYIVKFLKSSEVRFRSSSPDDVGEGEHKIVDFIRERERKEITKSRSEYIVYSVDGDLFILGSLLYVDYFLNDELEHPITIVRRSFSDAHKMMFFDIKGIVCELSSLMTGKNSNVAHKSIYYRSIYDFTLIISIIGNDFLPKHESVYDSCTYIDLLIQIYKEFKSENRYMDSLTSDRKILPGPFTRYISLLSRSESYLIYLKSQKIPEYEIEEVPNLLDDDLTCYEPDETHIFAFEDFRIRFYKKVENLFIKAVSETKSPINMIENMSEDYTKMLVWYFEYYTQGRYTEFWPDSPIMQLWGPVYKWNYAPLLCDFSKYFENSFEKVNNDLEVMSYHKLAIKKAILHILIPQGHMRKIDQEIYIKQLDHDKKYTSGNIITTDIEGIQKGSWKFPFKYLIKMPEDWFKYEQSIYKLYQGYEENVVAPRDSEDGQ